MLNLHFTRFLMSFLASSALIGIILLLKRVLKNHISVTWQYNMRFLFIVILTLPFVPSRFLDFGFIYDRLFGSTRINGNTAENFLSAINVNNVITGPDWLKDFTLSVNRSTPEYLGALFIGIWLTGVLTYAVFTFICYQKIQRIKKTSQPIENKAFENVFEQCKAELGIKRNLTFRKSHLIQSPTATGLLDTYIILPSKFMGQISESDIKYVILHELNHYKNKDLLVNSVMCFLQILYWFNPLVHLTFKEMRTDREIACDASVLKMLDKSNYINYGMTIIDFAKKLSQPISLTLATDMVGSKKQITKRIEKIATFTEDSRRLKIKSVSIFIIAGLLILTQIPVISVMAIDSGKYNFVENRNTVYEDLSVYFDGFEASFVLYDLQEDNYSIYNKDKSVSRVSPNSTYKIYSALTALELGVIQEVNSTLSWDGTEYPYEPWNKDHDLYSAMKDSVSWYFQGIDELSGLKNLQKYFTDIGYGNYDLSSGVSNYWQEASLLISPVEQVRLLKDFYMDELVFKQENIDTVKNALKLSEKDGAVLSGKTGTGSVNGSVVNGWFIGYVEKTGHTFIFATNIEGKNGASGSVAAQITLSILKDKNIY